MRGKRSSSSAVAESAQVKQARWAKRVEAWERSGQSQRAWCKAEGVSLSTLQWRRQRLTKEVPSERVPSFMPLRLEPEATAASIVGRSRLRMGGSPIRSRVRGGGLVGAAGAPGGVPLPAGPVRWTALAPAFPCGSGASVPVGRPGSVGVLGGAGASAAW